jgi:transposase-like protein
MSTWTPELKEQVIKSYEDAGPTAENSTEIIKDIAEEIEMTPNGVRMILIQAGVYVKKEQAPKAAGSKSSGDGPKRVNKETAIAELKEAIEAKGAPVDDDILGKLTGKAAVYLLSVINA